jgi:hypothetical protein
MLFWIAVQGLSPDLALTTLEMELSNNAEEQDVSVWPDFPNRRDYFDRIFMGQLPGDWLLLFGLPDEEDRECLMRLAHLGPAFAGDISRPGNWAEGHSYVDGQEVWSVDYDLESSGRHDFLKVEGNLPESLATIVDAAQADTAIGLDLDNGVDLLLDLPGKLSKAICGFTPDEEPPEGFRWSMLQQIGGEPKPTPKPKGCLALLFGWR